MRKADEAIKARQEHVEAFIEFNAALPAESTRAWTQLCQEWERDRTKLNPFHAVQTGEIFRLCTWLICLPKLHFQQLRILKFVFDWPRTTHVQ